MTALIFDIETIGEKFDTLDETSQGMLTRWLETETAGDEVAYNRGLENIKNGMGFSPLTGSIVAIGVLDSEKDTGAVYYREGSATDFDHNEKDGVVGNNVKKTDDSIEHGIKYRSMSEKEILEQFWEVAERYTEFVTFNGRGFDVPFMLIRSMVHGITPSRDLMEGRYLYQQKHAKHFDLADQLSFYGAARKGSLHLFCRALGIESPKAEGVDGDDVGKLYETGKYLDIAKYNARDLFATRSLFKRWNDTIR
jgi:3'-5' exonuclease